MFDYRFVVSTGASDLSSTTVDSVEAEQGLDIKHETYLVDEF